MDCREDIQQFQAAFRALQDNPPFLWQERLFARMREGDLPSALDLPTGLGKTSVMAIWLIARAFAGDEARKRIPRRLIYVVDRRAVVDQATEEAVKLRKALDGEAEHFGASDERARAEAKETAAEIKRCLGLEDTRKLPVSTLRGAYVDNKEWLENPTAPAIIVGTVDMIGSRLLFSGYGVSRKMRPYHAGLLGADTLIVLDEAHLVPPFEALISTIETGQSALGARDPRDRHLIPPLKLMSLSATGREREGEVFRLTDADRADPIVGRRLTAPKWLALEVPVAASGLAAAMAQRAWERSDGGRRVIVFCNSRKTALAIHYDLRERLTKSFKQEFQKGSFQITRAIELIVGLRRVREREDLANSTAFKRFSPKTAAAEQGKAEGIPAFLVCTSAGEVGVDVDADHMVCDLVAWERMVQRLGRVNRLGKFARSLIDVFPAASEKDKEAEVPIDNDRLEKWRAPFMSSEWPAGDDGRRDASPGELLRLRENETFRALTRDATTPAPLRPALSRALADAWSMTSLEEHTGRPDIQPWLRGWEDEEASQTVIVWRTHLPVCVRDGRTIPIAKKGVDEFFEVAPPQLTEMLEVETWRAAEWLLKRVKVIRAEAQDQADEPGALREHSPVLFVLDAKDELAVSEQGPTVWTLGQLAAFDAKEREREKRRFIDNLNGRTMVVDARLRGLQGGMLAEGESGAPPSTMDTDEGWPSRPFRVCQTDNLVPTCDAEWKQSHRIAVERTEDGDATRWLIVEEGRGQAENEAARAISRNAQTLRDHREAVETTVRNIASNLALPPEYREVLRLAARLHDEGKDAPAWRQAFGVPLHGEAYAKTKGCNPILLRHYRHEFGSLAHVAKHPDVEQMPADRRDLVLHLVAAHHGRARPLIETQGCDEPPSLLDERAREVALRFARLQKRWGPWGLAWWESLLRAADQMASRANDEGRAPGGAESASPAKDSA